MQISIELDGQKKLLDTVTAVDRELVKGIRAELSAGARAVRRDAKAIVKTFAFTGNLGEGIKTRTWRQFLSASIFVTAPHKYLVQHGRKAGKMPRPEVLRAYARARGIPERSLFILARAIGRKGTKGKVAFMQIAYLNNQMAIALGVRLAAERAFETEGGTK